MLNGKRGDKPRCLFYISLNSCAGSTDFNKYYKKLLDYIIGHSPIKDGLSPNAINVQMQLDLDWTSPISPIPIVQNKFNWTLSNAIIAHLGKEELITKGLRNLLQKHSL